MPRPIRDQVVVITGASSGIGRASALAFARQGARVVLAARNPLGLQTVAREIRQSGGQALAVPMDVTRPAEVEELAERALEAYGRIDTWVNLAAVSYYATFEQAMLAEMQQQMDILYWGNVHCLKAALPRMREGGGTFIAVGSILSDFSVPLQSTYCAAKHALKGLLESLRLELAHEGLPIEVVLVKPPSVDTPLFDHALTRMGWKPKPVAPVYDPAVIAREIVRSATEPHAEVTIGGAGQFFSWLHTIAPRGMERYLARKGFAMQATELPRSAEAPHNLYAPILEPGRIRADGNAWKVSWVMWAEAHPRTTLASLALAAGALAWVRRLRSARSLGAPWP